MRPFILKKADEAEIVKAEWGQLTWFANKKLGNSDSLTLGECRIKPGMSNPFHGHPSTEEILVVLRGKILHTFENGKTVDMTAGDTITVPAGASHCAKNIGIEECILMVAFPVGERDFEARQG